MAHLHDTEMSLQYFKYKLYSVIRGNSQTNDIKPINKWSSLFSFLEQIRFDTPL